MERLLKDSWLWRCQPATIGNARSCRDVCAFFLCIECNKDAPVLIHPSDFGVLYSWRLTSAGAINREEEVEGANCFKKFNCNILDFNNAILHLVLFLAQLPSSILLRMR